VLAPHSPLRDAATAYGRGAGNAREPPGAVDPQRAAEAPSLRLPARYLWAMLLACLFASLPLTCPHCGADMRIVVFATETAPAQRILNHIGEPAQPPPMWDDGLADAVPDGDALAQPQPEHAFDQQVQW
jgi:hypothetical protein